jgi:hypothetical protein
LRFNSVIFLLDLVTKIMCHPPLATKYVHPVPPHCPTLLKPLTTSHNITPTPNDDGVDIYVCCLFEGVEMARRSRFHAYHMVGVSTGLAASAPPPVSLMPRVALMDQRARFTHDNV